MRRRIKQDMRLGSLTVKVVGAGACLPPPGEARGDGWNSEGYRCESVALPASRARGGDGVKADEECDDGNPDTPTTVCKLQTHHVRRRPSQRQHSRRGVRRWLTSRL